MSRYLFVSLFLSLPLAHATDAPPSPNDHDLSYSLGASLGERLRQEEPNLQLPALLEGLQQAYENKPLKLKTERMEQILADHDAAMTRAEDSGQPEPQTEAALTEERRFLDGEKAKPGVRQLADGVLVSEITPGKGAKPNANGRVQVKYTGRLPDGTVFDQSQTPQWFRLDSVIAGWTVALQEMQVGAKWHVVIPSAQAYGAEGAGDLIDPYTPLQFDIELLNVSQ